MKILGYIFTTIFTAILSTIWGGYALSKLWEWFVVSTFDLPRLTVLHAIGLRYVVGFLVYQADMREDKRSCREKFWTGIAVALLSPAFALLFGFIVHKFY